jgi:hypothetical protein
MSKKKKEIQVHNFIWEGMPYTMTFIPSENGWQYQLMYEQTYKIITKGEIEY